MSAQEADHAEPGSDACQARRIVVLSGRWWIESMDGFRVEQGAGEFSFGEDQGCHETNGKKGHRSGTIGDEPCRLMTVQLHRAPRRGPGGPR